ncbi:MAG: FadR family transcriptional regulator [Lentisphaeria bacterium]|nr:FadR family transcriptional regulator [Lentisphaeria bacterium]
MVELTELRSTTLADGVEDSLLAYIRRSNLSPGDLLPKEEELAEQLKVSRHIVREGVSRLKSLGLVESRKRKGMILTRPNVFAGVSKLAEAKLFSDAECREFMQIRVFMELGMAESIFQRKTVNALKELRALAGRRGKHPTLEEEIAFHSKLVSIGGNVIGEQFLVILTSAFTYAFQKGTDRNVTPFHADLCDALEGKSAPFFCKVMKAHFEPYMN